MTVEAILLVEVLVVLAALVAAGWWRRPPGWGLLDLLGLTRPDDEDRP